MSENHEILRDLAVMKEAFRSKLQGRFKELEVVLGDIMPAAEASANQCFLEQLLSISHKLCGSAGTFGFPVISEIAGEMQNITIRLLDGSLTLDKAVLEKFRQMLNKLRDDADIGKLNLSINDHADWKQLAQVNEKRGKLSKSIILVDDDVTFSEVLVRQLTHMGYDIVALVNHADLRQVALERSPVAVIMDVAFPGDMDAGLTCIKNLRKDNVLSCPVIFLSVRGDFEARLSAVRAGGDGYLVKPVELVQLVDLLSHLTRGLIEDPFRVMIIDDEQEVADYHAALLQQVGFETEVVINPMSVMAKMHQVSPDVILMDVNMPECSGLELARVIRQDITFVHTPIIFLTASDQEDNWLHAMESGADEFLKKSSDTSKLFASVLSKARRARDLKQVADRLTENERRLRAIVETAHDAIITADNQGRIIFWNEAARKIFGYETTEILGQPITTIMPVNFRNAFRKGFKEVVSGKRSSDFVQKTDLQGQRKNGIEFPIELSLAEWHLAGSMYLTAVIRDISKRVEMERNFRLAMENAENANKAKSEFLSSMSHELRTPLNSIMGFSQILLMNTKSPLTEEQSRQVEMISGGGRHLLTLINEILDLATVESGKLVLSCCAVDLRPIIEECLSLMVVSAKARGIALINETDGVLPLIWIDSLRCKQVLLNLLSNAVKYNRENGTIWLSAKEISGSKLRVSIKDTGIGISKVQMEKIYRPFERLGAETTEIEGTGIGLVLTKKIIEEMGGAVGFTSSVGVGSTFWLDFPLAIEKKEKGE